LWSQQIQQWIDLLIIDYLQLIQVTDRAAAENQTQRVTYISNGLSNSPASWPAQ
jgi:replicative DNA helicase